MSFSRIVETEIGGMKVTFRAPASLAETDAAGIPQSRILESACSYQQFHNWGGKARAAQAAFLNTQSGVTRLTTEKDGKKTFSESTDNYAKRVKAEVGPEQWEVLTRAFNEKLKRDALDQLSWAAAQRGTGVPAELKPFVALIEGQLAKKGAEWFTSTVAKYDANVTAFGDDVDDEGNPLPTTSALLVLARASKARFDAANVD